MKIKFIYYNFRIIFYNLYSIMLTRKAHKLLGKNAIVYDKLRLYGKKRDLIVESGALDGFIDKVNKEKYREDE